MLNLYNIILSNSKANVKTNFTTIILCLFYNHTNLQLLIIRFNTRSSLYIQNLAKIWTYNVDLTRYFQVHVPFIKAYKLISPAKHTHTQSEKQAMKFCYK
jgi:hypothetical protein